MIRNYKTLLFILILAGMTAACGEGDSEQKADAGEAMMEAKESAKEAMQTAEQKAKAMADTAGDKMEQAGESMADATDQMAESAEDVAKDVAAGAKATVAAAKPETHVINAEARVFNPDIVYVKPGDTVGWTNMTSHNTVSVEGLIPEGAEHWRSDLGENLKVTLDVEGVYAYVCEPHIGFGMVGVIVVGQPTNLEAAKKYAQENLEGPYRRIIGKLIKIK